MWKNTITPRFSDTDALQHISNIAIIDWMEASRQDIFRLFTPDLDPKKWKLILARVNTDFLAQLYMQYDVEVQTSVAKIGNSSFTIRQVAIQNDKECAITEATLVHFDHDTQKSVPIVGEIRTALEKHLIE